MKKQTAKRIKESMKLRGVEKDDLIERTGVDAARLSGKEQLGSQELKKVARALRVSTAYLAGLDGALGPSEYLSLKLQEYKDDCGYANTDLADAVGVSATTVSRWLSGKAYPREEQIEALCELFDVSEQELVYQDEEGEVEPEFFTELLKRARAMRDELDIMVGLLEKASLV